MIAVDTNVIVRLMVGDDPAQFRRATEFISSQSTVLLTSVVMEAEWVLRKIYGQAPEDIIGALRAFITLEKVHVKDFDVVQQALDAYENGIDFADALHLAQSAHTKGFASFDKGLKRTAKRLGGFVAVVAP